MRFIVKLPVVDEETCAEPCALAEYNGDGAVHLLGYEPASGAMLLERLDPGTAVNATLDRDAAIEVTCALLRRLRRPAEGTCYVRAADLAARLAMSLPGNRIIPARWVAEAVEFAKDAAAVTEPGLLVNRDAHFGNVLAATREPWLLIDPKPLTGEPALEGSRLVRCALGGGTGAPHAMPSRREADSLIAMVADLLEVDASRVRGWTLLLSLQRALWRAEIGDDPGPDLRQAAVVACTFRSHDGTGRVRTA